MIRKLFTVFTGIATLGIFALALLSTDCRSNWKSFDAAAWQRGDMRTRGQMVRNLRNSHLLDGKTKPEVEQLLGPCMSPGTETCAYKVDIGHKFGGSPWPYTFYTVFDDTTGKVTRTSLVD